MLSYRHLFHAGNFADVLKHALLSRLIALLLRKDKPVAYVDTHAGIGRYDLSHPWARKLAEHRQGIARVWRRGDVPEPLAAYVDAVRADNPDGTLAFYPGSPLIAARALRAQDRLVLCELNAEDCATLKRVLSGDRRCGVHHVDAEQALKAFLPPRERRGLVLVDSPFDRAGDLDRAADMISAAHRRWGAGVLAVWYPHMEADAMRAFERRVSDSGVRRILQVELAVRPGWWRGSMGGCGVLVVNPPYGLADELPAWLEWLWRALSQRGEGGWRSRWLVPE